jgi:hypothetical protein
VGAGLLTCYAGWRARRDPGHAGCMLFAAGEAHLALCFTTTIKSYLQGQPGSDRRSAQAGGKSSEQLVLASRSGGGSGRQRLMRTRSGLLPQPATRSRPAMQHRTVSGCAAVLRHQALLHTARRCCRTGRVHLRAVARQTPTRAGPVRPPDSPSHPHRPRGLSAAHAVTPQQSSGSDDGSLAACS